MAGGMINYIRMLEKRPPEVTIRRWRDIRKSVMTVMGLHWHQHMLPKHFQPNAINVYQMARRTTKYTETKAMAAQRGSIGGRIVDPRAATDSLTLSGTLRANVTQVATIRVFEQRFKLIMPGTKYTPDRPRNPRMPPIAQEVTRLLEYEKTELAKLGKAKAVAELNSLRP
tara:strand:+ start:3501 stop:4010 length:510 start_codon:yes stop_codon:yes gene_type:complete